MQNSKKKVIYIIIIALIITIAITFLVKKPITYKIACNHFVSGDYLTAAKQFESLDGYRDSNKKYDASMTLALSNQVDELISSNPLSICKPVKYYTILDKCDRIINNKYFSHLKDNKQEKIINYYEYIQFLYYMFNFDSTHKFLKIDCGTNPYFSDSLTDFYNNYYKQYENQTWIATDKYNYYDEHVTTNIEINTNILLRLKDETKGFSDSNIEGYLRLYVSFEGSKYDNFSESCVVPVGKLNNIQITTKKSNLSQYYDTSQYKKEMGASNVAFVVNFEKEPPTIKYVPDYIENQAIRTLTLLKKH